jgi:transmembrane sensor
MSNQSNLPEERFWQLLSKKLCNEASEAELEEYKSLLITHTAWQLHADMLTQMWRQQNSDFPSAAGGAEAAYIKHLVKNKDILFSKNNQTAEAAVEEVISLDENYQEPGKHFSSNWKMVTAILLVVAATGWFLLSNNKETKPSPENELATSSVVTKNGNRTKMVLPDGSQVWLNVGSRLDYKDKEYNKTIREVSLIGEAYFDVVKDKEKPFIIHTAKINIKVLGTAFNVKSYPEEKVTETSLIRGSVEITVNNRPTEKYILKPSEKLVIANDEKAIDKPTRIGKSIVKPNPVQEPIVAIRRVSYLPTDSTVIETSWLENKFIFRSEDFEELAKRLERWYGVTIRFENEQINKTKFTGIFERETIEQALEALKMTAAFKYKMNKNDIIIY